MLDMKPTTPPHFQCVWSLHCDCLPDESHLQRYSSGELAVFQRRVVGTAGCQIDQALCDESLSQQYLQRIMNSQMYQPDFEGGEDNSSQLNDYFPESFSMVGTGLPNIGEQTTAQAVSLANCGRDVGPSQSQYSKKTALGNEQMFFSNHPTANAFTHDWTSSYNNQQQLQSPFYNSSGNLNPSTGIDFQHGLPPSSELLSTMPSLAERLNHNHVNPAMLSNTFTSSADSPTVPGRTSFMTNRPGSQSDRMPLMEFQSNHDASPLGIQEQSWVGSCPTTISPKMLRINPSPTPPFSSSESFQTALAATSCGGLEPTPSAEEDIEALAHEVFAHKARKQLPTKPNKPRPAPTSILLPRAPASSKGRAKIQARQDRRHSPLRPLSKDRLAKIEYDEEEDEEEEDDEEDEMDAMPTDPADAERESKNRFLVENKRKGMTYREIRRLGGFTEAESTLRGRFRTLTKDKDQRVRKPEWQEKDIRLLKKAVAKLARDDKPTPRVPWKQVATYIFNHGGSYHFGNATCRKKWDDLVKEGAGSLS
ncbi:hypothetical protein F4808DRAFT_471432 [Astrocystis sublimbata]|nr:hypothetical protein F4808DRAFT_471432 [Astrocystis sublimbata]